MRRDSHFSLGLSHSQIVGIQRHIARQRRHIQICHRGMQMERTDNILHVHIAKQFAIERYLPLDI